MATISELNPVRPAAGVRPPWGAALSNRRFRTLLLVLGGAPILVAYAWYGAIWPILWNELSDFRQVYLEGARVIAAGGDPYQCSTGFCSGHSKGWLGAAGAVYPPFTLWVMQPFNRFDPATVDAFALVAANLCLVAFIWIVVRALAIRDWQFVAVIALMSASFAPTLTEVQNRNFQVLLLTLSGVLLLAWRKGDRWWAGLALGLGLAIKLVEAPLLLLGLWGRRWLLVAVGVVVWAVLWLLAVPSLLPEYLFQVLPAVGRGSGEEMNIAPLGAVARLFHPESLYLQGRGVDLPVLAITALVSISVLAITAWRLRAPRPDAQGRSLEIAAAFAAMPLMLTLVWAGQLILLLLPMIVLLDLGLRRESRGLVLAVAISWLLIGPVYLGFTNAFAAGFGFQALFEVWVDAALAGAVILWVACLHSLKARA
ncbi:MAG TPA: glycosyltransferase 87 family protein [Candidatus Dormibacteraeota bacterium]|nr:glycosyltransferase 87 family protein [Candidatus Dormibacteraeota bacterium]